MDADNQIRWLSSKRLEGSYSDVGGLIYEATGWERAYELWEHAEDILAKPQTEAYLADAITNLKRAVNHRISILQETYHFDKIPGYEAPRRSLEQLAYWGIIRPSMLRQLTDIRNAIEHENATPPGQQRCLEFLDLVWYFLRSTDILCTSVPGDLEAQELDSARGLTISLKSTSPWRVEFSGWLARSEVSEIEIPGWIEAISKVWHTGQSAKAIRNDADVQTLEDDDLLVSGEILGPPMVYARLAKLFFDSRLFSGYSHHTETDTNRRSWSHR